MDYSQTLVSYFMQTEKKSVTAKFKAKKQVHITVKGEYVAKYKRETRSIFCRGQFLLLIF